MWQDYEVLEEIGTGASGVVYRAHHRTLNRRVALKVLHTPEGTLIENERFRREAALAASLDHPNTAPVYEFGEHDGRLFYAMKLIEGTDLSRSGAALRTDRRRLAATLAIVARALQHAHEKGVLHRDLKPANIVLDGDGQPHLVDFGLARSVQSGKTLTETGVIVGTPGYLSPEQAAGLKDLTPATDIWSLGVILYELLAGRLPFQSPTPYATLLAIQTQKPVPPGVISRGVPRDLQTICLRCLEKVPARRYPTAAALADDLERFSRGERVPSRPRIWKQVLTWPVVHIGRAIRWVKRNPRTSAAAAAVVLLVAAVVWLKLEVIEADSRASQARAEASEAQAEATRAEALAKESLRQIGVSEQREREARNKQHKAEYQTFISHLRQAEAEIESGHHAAAQTTLVQVPPHLRGWEHRYLMRVAQKYPAVEWKHPGATCVAFSPDGKRIVSGGEEVKLWDAESGKEIPFKGQTGRVRSVAFSPDGKSILTVSGVVTLWDIQTGKEQLRLSGNSGVVSCAAWSPDGKRIIVGELGRVRDMQELDTLAKVWDAVTGQEQLTLKMPRGDVEFVAFSPDGKRILTSCHGLRVWHADTGAEAPSPGGNAVSAAFSPDGRFIAAGGEDRTVRVCDAATGRARLTLKGHTSGILNVAFSPDGKRIISNGRWPDNTVRIWDPVSGRELLTIKRPKESRNIALSPDGKRIVGIEDGNGSVKVWDGSPGPGGLNLREAHQRLVKNGIVDQPKIDRGYPSYDGSLAFRDGNRIGSYFQGYLWLWDGEWGVEIARFECFEGSAISPDTKRLLCVAQEELIVWDLDSREVQHSLKTPTSRVQRVAFSPDSKRIVASGTDEKEWAVRVWDAVTGQEQFTLRSRSQQLSQGRLPDAVFSPDSQLMALCPLGSDTSPLKVVDANTGRELLTLKGAPGMTVSSVAFSPDGKRIIAGGFQANQTPPHQGGEGVVKVWDTQTGHELLTLKESPTTLSGVAFSPDGKRIIASRYFHGKIKRHNPEGGVIVWDAQTGQQQLTLRANMGAVYLVAFSSDGKRLVTESGVSPDSDYDGKGGPPPGDLKVWDAQTGQELRSFKKSSGVAFVTLSPDGEQLICTGLDGVQVLDVQTGR